VSKITLGLHRHEQTRPQKVLDEYFYLIDSHTQKPTTTTTTTDIQHEPAVKKNTQPLQVLSKTTRSIFCLTALRPLHDVGLGILKVPNLRDVNGTAAVATSRRGEMSCHLQMLFPAKATSSR
jgi:hypothetical protein